LRTTEELCASYERDAAKTRALAEAAFDRGAYPVAATVWAESAVSYLMRAMFGWRAALDDPRPWLDACVDVSEVAVSNLLTQPQWLRQFAYAPGWYGALLRDRVSSPLFKQATSLDGGAGAPARLEARLDAALVRMLAEDSEAAGAAIEASPSTGRLALMRRSFDTYIGLVRAGHEPTERARLTSDAVANYRGRRRDGFFAGGLRSEGGGEYNDLLVDYRLAAIWRRNRWSILGLEPEVRVHLLPDID
jgi:hypothetical protein